MPGLLSMLFGFLGLAAFVADDSIRSNESMPSVTTNVAETSDGGTTVVFILGQSNAQILFNNGAVQESLSSLGIDASVVLVAAGGESVARPDGAWNVVTGDGADDPGRLYTEFLDTYDDVVLQGSDTYVAGAIWVQGEADAYSVSPYYETTRALFEQMHQDTGVEFPISVVGLSDFHDLPDIPRSHVQGVLSLHQTACLAR